MKWQFSSSQPIYQQIVDKLAMDIIVGKYPKGGRMPSVRELAAEAAVNPNTMQRAFGELESMGLVETQRNSGRTVTTDKAVMLRMKNEMAEELIKTFLSNMRALGLSKEEVLGLLENSAAQDEQGRSGSTEDEAGKGGQSNGSDT